VATVAFTLWVVWPVLATGSYVTSFDTVSYSGPNLDLTLQAVRDGRLPQWNDAIYEGIPHLANMHAAALYPLKWPFAWTGVHQAWDLIIALHVGILAAGMWWLARRRLSLAPPAGLVATVAVVGSGMVMVRMLFFEQILVLAWAPWLLGCVDAAVHATEDRRARAVATLAVVCALTVTAGHSQLVYMFIPMVLVWAVARALDAGRARRLVDVAAAGALGAALAATQLLPTAALARRSANAGGRDLSGPVSSPAYAVQGRRLPGTLLGDPFAKLHTVASDGYENLTYIGATAAVLAVLGLAVLLRRRSTRWSGAGLALLGAGSLLLALGPRLFVYRVAFRVVPGFDEARVPARWSIVTVLVVGLAAAAAADALRRAGTVDRAVALATAAVVAVGALAIAVGPFHRPDTAALVAWAVAGLVVVAAAWFAVDRAGMAAAAVPAVLLLAELGTMNQHSAARAARAPAPYTSYSSPLVESLAADGDRVFALTADRLDDYGYLVTTLRPNANVTFGVRSLDGYDGGIQVTDRWARAVSELAGKRVVADVPLRNQLAYPLDPAAFARFGVHWLMLDTSFVRPEEVAPGWTGPVRTEGTIGIWENPSYRGDARVVGRRACDAPCPALWSTVDRPGAQQLGVSVDRSTPGVLVLAEQWDSGWHAEVDGTPARVIPVDVSQIGVEVPAGAHRVTLTYRAPGLGPGLVTTGAAAAVVVGLLLSPAGRRRRP
jgi:hypothetical protein